MSKPIRVPTLWILLPFASGIASASLLQMPAHWPLLLSAVSACACLFNRNRFSWKVLILTALLLTGYSLTRFSFPETNSIRENAPPREAEFSLKIERSFGFNQEYQSISGLARITATSPHLEPYLDSKVYFSLRTKSDDPIPIEGYTIKTRAVLESLPSGEHVQAFHHYLRYRRVSFLYTRGDLLEIQRQPHSFKRGLHETRNWIQDHLSNNVLPDSDYTRAYLGMILGLKSELSAEQKDLFLQNGTMHLFAISGLHIGVVATCIHYLLILLRFPKNHAPFLSILLLAGFVILTGGMASAWRAFIMISCLYLGTVYKRQSNALNALSVSAIICLLIDPLQLFLASFQMSYATVASILLFGVPLAERFQEQWQPFKNVPPAAQGPFQRMIINITRFAVGGFWVSLAAFMTSSLFGILYFNTFPTLGILTNLILLPIASLVIVAGFCSLIGAAIPLDLISQLFNNAAILLLAFIHKTLEFISSFSFTSLEAVHSSGSPLLLATITLIAILAFGYERQWRVKTIVLFLPPLFVFAYGLALSLS